METKNGQVIMPCKHCGGEAIVRYESYRPFYYGWIVRCTHCGISTRGDYEVASKAIEVWNNCGYNNANPYKPNYGEMYWTYISTWLLTELCWDGDACDYIHLATGCVFKTQEEAELALPKKYFELTGEEWVG